MSGIEHLADEARRRREKASGRTPPLADDEASRLLGLADTLAQRMGRLREEIGRVIVGQDSVIEELIIALLAEGHVVLEGVPGLAKTLLVNTLGSALSLQSGRIQFTPDLMPADVTGTQVVVSDRVTGAQHFSFQKGPVFVNLLLADEINRTPPKTQAALLEAMAEKHVTVAGHLHPLPTPFFVLATQNPIEQEGTYVLPEAQLDRFLFKVTMDYPLCDEEFEVMKRTTGEHQSEVVPVLTCREILDLQRLVRALRVTTHVMEYATALVRRTRPNEPVAPDWVREAVAWGAGPRATQALVLAAKARTLLQGRFSVTRADVRDVALPVLRHRLLLNFPAEAQGLTVDDLICRLLVETPPFAAPSSYDAITRRILRF